MTQRTYNEIKIEQYDKWLVERDLQIAELEQRLFLQQQKYDDLVEIHRDHFKDFEKQLDAHLQNIHLLKQRIDELETELLSRLPRQ